MLPIPNTDKPKTKIANPSGNTAGPNSGNPSSFCLQNVKCNNPHKIFPATFFRFVIKITNPESCKPSIIEDARKTNSQSRAG